MRNKKNFDVADILQLINISSDFIERNRKVYERLASGIPTQGILDSLIPELIDLYGDYVIQINQYESDLSYITLAILVTDDYDIPTHMAIFDKHHRLLEKYNDQYGDATLSITEYRYSSIINPEVHNSQAHAIRKGDIIWKKEKQEK